MFSDNQLFVQGFTKEQIEAFFSVGYVILPRVFGEAELVRMREAFMRLHAEAQGMEESGLLRGAQFVIERILPPPASGDRVRIHRICWCGAAEPILMEVGRDPRLLEPVAALLGVREADHLINQAHFKMPEDGVSFPWHQDSTHRRYGTPLWTDLNGRGSYVQTALAVDEVTLDNGPLLFLPYSGTDGHNEALARGEIPPHFDFSQAVPACMEPGSVAFFGPYTVHSSLPNRSASPRRILINGYAYPEANRRVYPGEGAGQRIRLLF